MSQTPGRRLGGNPHGFTITADLAGGRISLAGRLDRATCYHLLDVVRSLNATDHPRWAIETAGLCSGDASGLRALSACYRRALRQGAQLSIVDAPPWLQAALAAVRLDLHVMGVRPNRTPDDPR